MAPTTPTGSKPQAQPQVVDLSTLSIEQLEQVRNQFESELRFYQDAIVSLKEVQMKMQDSGSCLQYLKTDEKRELLVPLTSSMYVKGELEDSNHVLVDIGTGYLVKKTIDDAADYFKRKVEFLTTQIDNVQKVGRDKSTAFHAINDILGEKKRAKLAEMQKMTSV